MKKQDLQTMFTYLRRAFTSQDSRGLLRKFFPSDNQTIQELTDMSDVQNTETPVKQKKVTNMDRARAIYEASPDKSRKEIIRLFQENIPGMAQATASTYFYQVAPDREKRVPNVAKAREIYSAAPIKTRKAIIPEFMKLGMNENVASTYYYNCKKYFSDLAEAQISAESASIGAGSSN